MNNTSKVLLALAAGTVVGAALGILFAPAKGEDTRENIVRKGKEFAEDLTKKFRCTEENVKHEAFN